MEKIIELKDASSRRLLIGTTAFMNSVMREQGPNDCFLILHGEKVYFKKSFDELKEELMLSLLADNKELVKKKKAKTRKSSQNRPEPVSSKETVDSLKEKLYGPQES